LKKCPDNKTKRTKSFLQCIACNTLADDFIVSSKTLLFASQGEHRQVESDKQNIRIGRKYRMLGNFRRDGREWSDNY